MEWKDVTSYSRDDKERKPTTFEAKEGALRIVITCGHINHRPQWVMHCGALSIDTYPLKEGATKEQAEEESLALVHERLEDLAKCAAKLTPNDRVEGRDACGASLSHAGLAGTGDKA